jgi:peptidoglycan DL-endopeptidase CwlO
MAFHRRAMVLRWGLGATMITSIVALSVIPTLALADQISDKKAQAAALAQKIDADARQVEVLAEQYNGAQYHLAQVQQQLSDAEQGLQAAQAEADRNRAALAAEAVQAYVHGGMTDSPTLKTFSGSVDLAVQQGYFRLATSSQADALDQLRKSEQILRDQQVALQTARQESQAAVAAVTGHQQAVQAAAAASQATLNQVQGDLVDLVAQQQADISAQQQAQARTSLPAAQAKVAATGNGNGVPAAAPTVGQPATAPTPAPGPSSSSAGGAATAGTPTSRTAITPSTAAPTTAAPTTAPPTTLAPPKNPPPPPSSGAGAAVAYARAQLGKPYQWGAAGPDSFDCSGLTMRAWEAGGVSLAHYAAAQYANTAHVAIANLQPGDLVFFGSDLHHVGLYIGGGQMIDAPSTGSFVRTDTIYWPDLQPYGGRPS